MIGKVLVAAAAVVSLYGASQADASANTVTAITVVDWGGTNCLDFYSASMADHYVESGEGTQCSSSHSLTFTDTAISGQIIGIDPVMGDNDWISCTITVNGVRSYPSYASRGDGTDVNCMRTVV